MPPGHSPLGGILTSHHKSTKIQLHCRSRVTCRFPDKPAMNSLFSRATNLTSKIMLDMFTHVGVTLLASRQGPSGPVRASRCEVQQHWPRRQSKSPDLGKCSWPQGQLRKQQVSMLLFYTAQRAEWEINKHTLGYKVWKHFQQKNNETSDIQPTNIIYACFLINQNGGIKPAIIAGSQWENHGIDMIQLTLTFGLEKLIEMG